jgi:hypothetical protein
MWEWIVTVPSFCVLVAQFVQYIELTERPLPLSEFESTEVDLSVQ